MLAAFVLLAFGWHEADAQTLVPRSTLDVARPIHSSHLRMGARLEEIAGRVADENPLLGDRAVRQLEARLATLPDEAPGKARLLLALGVEQLRMGREQIAIDQCLAALKLAAEDPAATQEVTQSIHFWLGMCYLRFGETQNCCNRNTPDSCLVPIRGEGIHVDRHGSEQAIEQFRLFLKTAAPDSAEFHRAQWLLNIACMTIGSYPQGVPEEYLIDPSVFQAEEAFPRFFNVAHKVGLDTFHLSGGAIADDFDNDGLLDLVVSCLEPAVQIRYFKNLGNGQFADRTEQAGLTGITGGLNLVQADYDNDGFVDFLVLRGAWFRLAGRHPNSLVHNNGDGTFTDVTFDAGLAEVDYPTQTGSWADFDLDGDLDLYIGNESQPGLSAPCQLFRNNGDGTFIDIASQAGVTNDHYTKAVIWGDYDDDRWPDLYVSNLGAPNRLYHNNGDGTFTDVAPQLGVTQPIIGFPAWFWDFDNDGKLDISAFAYDAHIEDIAADALGKPFRAELARLYRNTGSGFEDVAQSCNLVRPNAPMGCNFGDLDGDGFLDFYLGTGRPLYYELMPNLMFHNLGGKRFTDITVSGGFGNLQKGHAVVFADLDHDGDLDVFEQMGGAVPGDKYFDMLYENPGFGNNWLAVRLIGRQSNRSAIGGRIRADVVDSATSPLPVVGGATGGLAGPPTLARRAAPVVGDEGEGRRVIYRHVNSGGTFGANPLRQYLGLGQGGRVRELQVHWPKTGKTQRFRNLPVNQLIEITEGDERVHSIPLQPFKLGGSQTE